MGVCMGEIKPEHDEEELRKSHRLLLDAESIGQIGSWEIDLVTGDVITTGGNRRLFFGDDASQGSRFEEYSEAVHPDDRAWVLKRREDLLRGTGSPEIEYRIILPDGEVRVIRGLQRVVRDANGTPVRAFGTNVDLTDRRRAEDELGRRVRQQAAVAQLGQSALQGGDVQALFDEALALVVRTCSVEIAEVAELLGNDTLLLRAAIGWKAGLVGSVTLPASSGSQCAYTLVSDEPCVMEDLSTDARFSADPLLLEQGIVSGVSVLIKGDRKPFGVLGFHSKTRRAFAQEDINFLQSIANVLTAAIEHARASAELLEKREQLSVLSRKLIEAQEAERRAIARELHDDFGQVLTALRTNLQRDGASPAQSRAENVALIDAAIDRLRNLAFDLRPPVLDDLGLAAALRWYVEREGKRAGLAFEIDIELEQRLLPAVETTCFRVAQEALTNVVRHANARWVGVSLRVVSNEVELVVRDDGSGFDVQSARASAIAGASQGLLTMEERASLAGGSLSIESAQGRGTTVRARFSEPRKTL